MGELFRKISKRKISIFANIKPPPYGGVSQFFRALSGGFLRNGFKVYFNEIPRNCELCILNSFDFDQNLLMGQKHLSKTKVVHRVDGPVSIYRGEGDVIDREIWDINQKFADVTVFQSNYSIDAHDSLGLSFKQPVLIGNASDPEVFFAEESSKLGGRKVNVVASSWSSNPNKGLDTYLWLDQHLDFTKYNFTFIGRIEGEFQHIKILDALPSVELANELRKHDFYVTASRHDPCSNSLIEALSCGLPAVYLKSGGHGEIVKRAGLGFDSNDELIELFQKLVDEYDTYRVHITPPDIEHVTQQYIQLIEE